MGCRVWDMDRLVPRGRHQQFDNAERPTVAMEANWPAGESTGWHAHPRGQLLYAIDGVMNVQSAAGSWVIPPSSALWLVAGVRHNVTMSGDVKMRTAYIDAGRVEDLPAETRVITVSPLLRELLVAAVQVPVTYGTGGRDENLMQLLVHELRRSATAPLHLPMPQDRRLKVVCDALIKTPSNTFTALEWAEKLGVTAKTVHRLFVQETGMTFAQWRDQARLLHALRRIAEGWRVIDIAFDCGYSSQSAFTAMFKRHFGSPPSSMRSTAA